jgi:2,4-dienoyl-CoA reductase-like NADH-dependent reductase (Old Yellow Enzyme family)
MTTETLFRPFHHPKLPLNNRIIMAPMTRYFSPNSIPGDDVVEYYKRRAENAVGLILTEGTTVNHKAASSNARIPKFYDESLDGWGKVVEAVHKAGGKIAPQLWHIGAMRKEGEGPYPEYPSATPSGLVGKGKQLLEALSSREIDELIKAFTDAAKDAKDLGFDAIELHGAHGYLLDNFFWEVLNQREDGFGGSVAARTRFAAEIVESIRAEVGESFPIILRFSQWKQQDFDARLAPTKELLEQFCSPLSAAGVDIFHCSTRRFWEPEFSDSSKNLAGWVKEITGKPTISVGSVGLTEEFVSTYRDAEAEVAGIDELIDRMAQDEFDLIAIGRALIANPDWAVKVRDGRMDELITYDKKMLESLN